MRNFPYFSNILSYSLIFVHIAINVYNSEHSVKNSKSYICINFHFMYFIYKKLNFNLLYIVDIIIKCQHCNDFNIEIIFK